MGIDIIGVFLFILGGVVGSFLNVCIVRLPHEESVVKPRSHCVHCKKMIPWYDNVPFLSYLILRGRCRFCSKKVSVRYIIVEAVTALSFLGFYKFYGLDILLVPYLFMMCCFIIATFVDFEHRIIPDEVSIGGMCVGLVLSLLIPQLHDVSTFGKSLVWIHLHSLGLSLLGALVGGGLIYLMGLLGDFFLKKESMGGGDVKLLAMVGAFIGWKLALLTFFLAPFFAALYGIEEKIRTGDSAIAYGPFLVLGSLVCLFWGDLIIASIIRGDLFIAWIVRGYGIV